MKHCPHCSKENRDEARFCGHCGRPFSIDVPKQTVPATGNSGQAPHLRTAPLLSCFWPGLGQIYNGQILKGAAFIVIQGCLWPGSFFLSNLMTTDLVLGPLFFLGPPTAFWIYGMTDAKRVAEGKKAWGVFPTEKRVAVAALGVMIVFLLSVAFFVQKMEEAETPASKRLTAGTVDPQSSAAARKKLEQMGIPYTQVQFFREAESGNTEAIELFLAAGMNSKTQGFMGTTALERAVSKGHIDTVQVLLSNGANPNQETFGGMTLLMSAAGEGHTDIVRALLDKGAYVNAKGPTGLTALKLATNGRHADTVQLLKQAGARE